MGAILFIQSAVDDMPLLDVGRKRLSLPQRMLISLLHRK
jgi:hypothetical protein